MTIKRLAKNPELANTMTRKELDITLDEIDDVYYTKGERPVSDDVYDRIMDIYAERFPKSSRLKKVGAKIGTKRAEVALPYPMSSLDKVKTGPKLDLYLSKYSGPFTVSDKEDGMSLELGYSGGKPVELYTRGDGLKGQDVSHLIPYLKIPKKIPVKDKFYVRVEGISSNSTFAKHLHEDAGGAFTAVRNAAGGIINKLPTSKDFDKYAKYAKHLTLFAFKILAGKGSNLKPSEQFKLLESYGFDVVPHKVVKSLSLERLSAYLSARIKASDYEIDGLVIEQDKYHPIGHAKPKHAVSFKENSRASMVEVIVVSVTWNVSRTGRIVPQINIKPTQIGGVTVSNFTGHNAFYIAHGYLKDSAEHKAKQKPRPIAKGAKLLAVRSGQVIPYVQEVLKGASKPSVPDIAFKKSGVDYVIVDKADDTMKQKKIEHFFKSIGVEGFKLSTVQRFWNSGYKTLSSFLNLTIEDFESIDGMGKQKGRSFMQSLRKSLSDLTFAKIADASGYFPGFSKERFTLISDAYPDILEWDLSPREIESRIRELRGFKEIAVSFAKNLSKLQKLVDKYGFDVKVKKAKISSTKMKGLFVTFTGVRDNDLQAYIESNGGKVQSMKSDTNVVLVKDNSFSSSKVDKAQEKGIPVMTLDEFKTKYKVKI